MTRIRRKKAICGVTALCLGIVLLSTGCLSKERVYEDIRRNRRAAYEAWKRAKAGEKGRQEVVRGKLSMTAAVLFAMGNNKQLKATLEEKENADGRITEAYSSALPKLDVEASYTRKDKVGGFTAGGVPVVVGQKSNYAVRFVLTQPIFRGGAIAAGIRGAKLFYYAADQQISGTIQDVVHQTRLGYYDVLLGRELVNVSEGDLGLARAHLEDVRKKKAAGVVSQYDVLRARVEVSNVEAELIERQNALHLAMTLLLKTMGVSQESNVELTDKLEYKDSFPALEEAVEKAFHERPEILQAELNVRVNKQALIEAWSGFLPRLDGTFTQSHERPDPHNQTIDHWGQAWEAGLVLTWPLFDGLASWGRTQQAKANLRRSVIELAEAEEQALLEVKQALFSLEDARKFVKSQADNLERAREGLRLAQAGYDAGVNTEIERLDAFQALSQTRANHYQAVYRHETAKLALERATGALKNGEFEKQIK